MTAATAELLKLSYWIDSGGAILRVDGPWERWLRDDGSLPDRCREPNVIGKSLFSFIGSEGVQHVYQLMHARVRETGRAIEFPFRCDSSWVRREMQMTIRRDRDLLRYDSLIVKQTRRNRPLPEPTHGAEVLVAMCSFCKAYRFPVESLLWKNVESLFTESQLPALFSVTHGMCDPCAELWMREL